MTEDRPLRSAIATMLVALNVRADPERCQAFVDALDTLDLCHACGAIAAGRLTAYLRKRPLPSDLALETRDVMQDRQRHMGHLGDRQLQAGDGTAWWQSEGRSIIAAIWPDHPNLGWLADQVRREGYMEAGDVDAIRACVGNPGTPERAWWERHAAANLEPSP
jgi:hypothetical protein